MIERLAQKKKLGQVFLKDQNIIKKILAAAAIQKDEKIAEIGCGEGWLSLNLAKAAKSLTIFEFDPHWLGVTKERLKGLPNVNFVLGDVLEQKLEGPCRVVANIPYNISAKIIKWLIDERAHFSEALLMVQKEFAHKILAQPGETEYTSFSVYCRYFLDAEFLFSVSKNCFRPIPKIDSAVIRLRPRKRPFRVNEELFFNTVKTAFWARRKTLKNCLEHSPYLNLKKGFETIPFLSENERIRGEMLDLDAFFRVYSEIKPFIDSPDPN